MDPMPITLLNSKLHPPNAAAARLPRPRLYAQLDAAIVGGCPLVLISTPAGYGKTTLVTDWVRDRAHPTAWLSLDPSDNASVRFWSYLIAALQTVNGSWGARTATLLDPSAEPALDDLVSALLQELEVAPPPEPTLLVLDDFHLIQAPPIHDSLLFLLTHLPRAFHLVLLSRADPPLPLARLRVQQQLVELRASDLRFTVEEVTRWLNQQAALALSPEDIATLASRTEGWAAGLQLAVLSLHGRTSDETRAFLDAFSGTEEHVFSYLLEEVLTRQPASVQRFLLHTSILPRLTAPLCEALVPLGGQAGGYDDERENAHQMLGYLERAGLFISSLDTTGHWFRYHHLFAEMLQTRLHAMDPEGVPRLHQRAAAWFAAQNDLELAVRHALAGDLWEQAASYIERAAESLWAHGGLSTLHAWLEQLPEEAMVPHLRLQLLRGWMLFLNDHYDDAESCWQRAESHLHSAGDDKLRGELAAMRGALAAMRQQPERTIPLAEEALRLLPVTDRTWRGAAAIDLGLAHTALGAVRPAIRAFQQAVTICQQADNRYLTFVALWHLAEARLAAGQLREAKHTYEQIGQLDEGGAPHPLVLPSYAKVGMGRVAYTRDALDEADKLLASGLGQLPPDAQPRVVLVGLLMRARIRQARGEGEAALAFMRQATAVVERAGLEIERDPFAARAAILALRQGRLWEAEAWAHGSSRSPSDTPDYRYEVEHLALARVLIAQGDSKTAIPLLERLLEHAESHSRLGSVLKILTLLTLAQAASQPDAAQRTLVRALALAEREGYVRLFLDEGPALTPLLRSVAETPHGRYARHLLSLSGPAPLVTATDLSYLPLDPLTEREMEVLSLAAQGATNQQIAQALVIGVGTVKGHINHILSKLDAQNRTEAVVRAQAIHLL